MNESRCPAKEPRRSNGQRVATVSRFLDRGIFSLPNPTVWLTEEYTSVK